MQVGEVIAQGYRYPSPTAAAELSSAIDRLPPGAVQRDMRRFLDRIERLPLGEWEELHTSTLDLSPRFIPYVGHVVWGENYRRGEFMADLNAALRATGVPANGELPDHIEPVLRYLAGADDPLADLIEVLPGAVATMQETLAGADPDNPYRALLDATAAFTADFRPLTIRGAR